MAWGLASGAVDPQVLTGGAGGCTAKVTHMTVSRKLQFPATGTGLPEAAADMAFLRAGDA